MTWRRRSSAKHPGDRLTITVERDGRQVEFQPSLQPFSIWWSFALIILIFMPWLSILLGFWVAAMRPRDAHAWLVLGILLGLSQVMRPPELDPRGWPFVIGPTRRGVPRTRFRRMADLHDALRHLLSAALEQSTGACRGLSGYSSSRLPPSGFYSAASNVAASFDWNLGQWPDVIPQGILTALSMSATGVFFMALASKYPDPSLAHDDTPPPQSALLGLHRRHGPHVSSHTLFADRYCAGTSEITMCWFTASWRWRCSRSPWPM